MQNLLSMKDKVVVITGSTRGIGLATARLFGEHGARLVISSRKAEACAEVVAAFAADGIEAVAIPAHTSDRGECDRLIAETVQHYGGIDCLVSNAATNPVFSDLAELEDWAWDKVIETNLTAPWRLTRAAYPHMAARGGGSVVLLSSIMGQFAMEKSGAYGVSKAGLYQLARQLASEMGARKVRVNTVSPGATRTDMIRTLTSLDGWEEATTARMPLGRLAEPEDLASTILFLASDASRHITGQNLVVDGGTTIRR